MRSGSPANDGGGWPSAQRPNSNEALGNQGRHASGARSEPQDGQGPGRRDVPFGPEISWPYGFRQLDPDSRDVLESAYGTGPVYQQPAMDDYGYGDPGYSDPTYEGPKTPYGSPAHGAGRGTGGAPGDFGGTGYRQSGGGVPGYQLSEVRDPSPSGHPGSAYQAPGYPAAGRQPQPFAPSSGRGDGIWPVTGAQGALRDTGPQPTVPGGDSRPSRSADPRLAGMTYGELRYEEPGSGESGHDERLDDESWYQELRRSAPAYPQSPGGPQGPGSGPQGRAEPSGPAFGQQAGYPQAPDRASGYGQPRRDGSAPQGPQMSAGRSQPGPAAPGAGFLSAPVGLLTPPGGTRVDALRDGGTRPAAPAASPRRAATATQTLTIPASPNASRPGTATVRPGHGLDGPEITSSWPAQPAADDVESFEDFWRDDADEEYTGLFGNREAEFERADAKQAAAKQAAAKRQTGRRRGGSNDRRLWLGLGGVVVLAAAAIVGIIKFEFPSHSGPAHTMATPDHIGSYARTVDLEHQADVAALKQKVIAMSSGQASNVVSAVYESGKASAGNTTQIIMFIGGHLANADPAASITSFTQQFKGAQVVSAGAQGGKAACVQDGTGPNSVAMCAWFDNDSFGEVVSPTMNASTLASAMRTVRPSVEVLAPK